MTRVGLTNNLGLYRCHNLPHCPLPLRRRSLNFLHHLRRRHSSTVDFTELTEYFEWRTVGRATWMVRGQRGSCGGWRGSSGGWGTARLTTRMEGGEWRMARVEWLVRVDNSETFASEAGREVLFVPSAEDL